MHNRHNDALCSKSQPTWSRCFLNADWRLIWEVGAIAEKIHKQAGPVWQCVFAVHQQTTGNVWRYLLITCYMFVSNVSGSTPGISMDFLCRLDLCIGGSHATAEGAAKALRRGIENRNPLHLVKHWTFLSSKIYYNIIHTQKLSLTLLYISEPYPLLNWLTLVF